MLVPHRPDQLRNSATAGDRVTCIKLHDAGFSDAHIIDEAYGRALAVTDPQGESVYVNERMQDTYGYRVVS